MKGSDQQSPHAVGIADTAGSETNLLRQTPPGISNVPTDDVLAMPGELKDTPIDIGMWPNTLSPATQAALTGGFQTDEQDQKQDDSTKWPGIQSDNYPSEVTSLERVGER